MEFEVSDEVTEFTYEKLTDEFPEQIVDQAVEDAITQQLQSMWNNREQVRQQLE